MKYKEITIYTGAGGSESAEGILITQGITGTVVNDPGMIDDLMEHKKDYEWDYVDPSVLESRPERSSLTFYLDDDAEGEQKLAGIKAAFAKMSSEGAIDDVTFETRIVDDEDWKNKYKEFFKTLRLTDNLVVRPSWDDTEIGPGLKIIDLDPGMAFGTGGHATTSMCAEMLDEEGCAGKKVLDVGCGSGVLSIAAAFLGAEEVLGIDIDDQAVISSRENVEKNRCGDVVSIQKGDLTEGVDFKADIIAANLMAELIVRFAPHAADHMNGGGAFIASGILTEKKKMVTAAMEQAGLTVEKIADRGEWCALLARKA